MLAIVIGTGPSLTQSAPTVRKLQEQGWKMFGVNNVYLDFQLDVWIACDPKWHEFYSPVSGSFDKWHWDKGICEKHGYRHVEGVWADGLSTDPAIIHLNHGSGPQILNLAATQYQCAPILLVGHDFSDSPVSRHYFNNLSDVPGEYPEPLRKWSKFDKGPGQYDMMDVYKKIADQGWPIFNCTPNSKLPWFEFKPIESFLK